MTIPTLSSPRVPGLGTHGSLAWAWRMTVAALLALALAMGLGIRHPWWAAMTVWLAAQPSRGLPALFLPGSTEHRTHP